MMSSSPSRAPVAASPQTPALSAALQPFPYDSIPPGASTCRSVADGLAGFSDPTAEGAAAAAARETQARALGRQEGLTETRKIFDEQLGRERLNLSAALAEFTRDRAAYFQKVEGEVVQLALSIARKILHREAQLDPLLLAGIVRVALEKIDGATGVVLRIHPENAADWRRYLAAQLAPADRPEIVEDPAHPLDRCTLETSMGTAVIGLEMQLKEIEQGLMDLLAARPSLSAANAGAANAGVANTEAVNAGVANQGAA
jgi:flagellar biosynthesis/type III secretory pathway protein FliH